LERGINSGITCVWKRIRKPSKSDPSFMTCLHSDVAMVNFFVAVLVVVVDSKHNRSEVSFQIMKNEIVREETTQWQTPTPKLILQKAPILGSEAKERLRKDLQNCMITQSLD
jgi:hypothetical protein